VSRCGIFSTLAIRFWSVLMQASRFWNVWKRESRFSIDEMLLNRSDVMLVIHYRYEISQNVWMRRNRI
jgi:hypothetical protein